MAIRSHTGKGDPFSYRNRLRIKADQAWDMAGLARQDGDKADEARWTAEARRLQAEISECSDD